MKKKVKDLTITDLENICKSKEKCSDCPFNPKTLYDTCYVNELLVHWNIYYEQEIEVDEDDK